MNELMLLIFDGKSTVSINDTTTNDGNDDEEGASGAVVALLLSMSAIMVCVAVATARSIIAINIIAE